MTATTTMPTRPCHACAEDVSDSPDGWHNDESGMDCPAKWTTGPDGEPEPGPHDPDS